MSGFGSCNDSSSGSSTGLVATTRIVAGSQTISAGNMLGEDDTGLLDEDGGNIALDSDPSAPTTVTIRTEGGERVGILAEDGSVLDVETGDELVAENSSSDVEGDLLGEDNTPILNEDSVSAVAGSATPLMYVSTSCQYVVVSAKSTNTGTVWVSGSDVEVGLGIPLLVGEDNVQLPIDDVAKIYIIGNIGDGVTFVYGTTTTAGQLTDDSGNLVTDDSGNPVTS